MGEVQPAVYLPTPRQISAACAAIRLQWSPAERRRRSLASDLRDGQTAWAPPEINTALCMARVRRAVIEQSA
jgi:hypothetical protein